EALVGEEALQGAVQRRRVVLLVQQPLRAANALPDRAVEDLRPLLLVEADELLGRERVGRGQRAGQDAARGGAGDQVEQLVDPFARALLDLGQDQRRDQ